MPAPPPVYSWDSYFQLTCYELIHQKTMEGEDPDMRYTFETHVDGVQTGLQCEIRDENHEDGPDPCSFNFEEGENELRITVWGTLIAGPGDGSSSDDDDRQDTDELLASTAGEHKLPGLRQCMGQVTMKALPIGAYDVCRLPLIPSNL